MKVELLVTLVLLVSVGVFAGSEKDKEKIPVIFDTDIGDDIDDTWALGFLLRSPRLEPKLVVGDNGKAVYRAKLICKFLEAAGKSNIPVGVGLRKGGGGGRQSAWIKGYELASYPGKVHPGGVQAIIDTIMKSRETVTVVAVGPLPNIAEALKREPKIAERARFVGMHGSVRLGYGGSKKVAAEYNVRADPAACQKVFTAPWDITITPLDTCGLVQLTGDEYKMVLNSEDGIASAVVENYRIWAGKRGQGKRVDSQSSTLFDTVAVYLAYSQKLVKMEKLGIRVTDKGFTVIDPEAKTMKVATAWKDMDAFESLLARRIAGKKQASEGNPEPEL